MNPVPKSATFSNAAQDRPKGEIEIGSIELVNAIDELDQLTPRLGALLQPILGPERPPGPPANKPEEGRASDLGTGLFRAERRIRDANSRLQGLIDRICL